MTSPDPTWRVSSFSDYGECVGLAPLGDGIAVVNTNRPEAGHLTIPRAAFAGLIAGIKAGQLDHLA